MPETRFSRGNFYRSLLILFLLVTFHISTVAQGTQVDFSTIPKSGTILIYSHMDDDLIWMLPFWNKTEKFIGGAMPATPSYRAIISQQQAFLDNNGYNIAYQSNWYTPWDDVTDAEYTEYYWGANTSYYYLLNDHLETRLYSNPAELSRFEINKIKAKLEQYFADPSMSRVITHNNWGEYGHQHHRGLNKAVRELAVKYRKDVWMLGCDNGGFIDVNVPDGITYAYGSFNTPELYTGIRDIYSNNGRWTWYTDRVPSGDHKFIKIVEGGSDKSNILKGDEITLPGPSQLESGAFIFDGDDDYLTLKGNNNPSFTISMRIRPDQIREMDISAMSEYPLSTKNDRNLYLSSDGHITARIFDGSSKSTTSTATVSAGSWSHVAITSNGSSLKLYVNGILDKTIPAGTAITNYSTPEFILGQATQTISNFSGQISNVKFYNYALTDNEIAVQSGMVFTVNSSAATGGTINPQGVVSVVAGTDKTFTITPNTGNHISSVSVDGVSINPVTTYTFHSVMADHSITAEFAPSASYTITASAGTGGTITPSGIVTVYEGTNQTFNITGYTGYRLSDLKIDDVSVGAVSTYTFTNIAGSHSIAASFETIPTHNITASAGPGGSVTPSGITTVNEGTNLTYNIIPSTGYKITDVLADGVSAGSVSSFSFNNIVSDHTISATFELLTFTLTSGAGSDGSISPSGVLTLTYGSSQNYSISPNTGYRISGVLVDNVSVGTPSAYSFSNISANHTIAVSFSPVTNTITATAGTGGTISPQGNVSVNYGASQTFNISANTGYYLSDVKVDNISVGAVSSYNFANVTAGHSISATYTQITYTITGSAGTGGSINPSGNTTVNHGSARTFTITPDFGFQVSDVKVDNVSVGPASTYTFSNITSAHTISASFATATYTITAGAGSGGSINPTGASTVIHGTSLSYTVVPFAGYRISDVRVDNVSVGTVSSYTFNNVSSGHSISATFSIITFNIVSQAGSGGIISPNGNITVDYGSGRTFNITQNTGQMISDVLVDNVSVGPVSSYTFSNITNNHTISVVFSHITYAITGIAGSGGSVSPSGTTRVNYGSQLSYTISPDEGFNISDVKIDNASAGAISSYDFTNIRSDHTVSASFVPITFTITSGSKSGGSITPSGTSTLNYGSDLVCLITPDTGFHIDDVIIDNKSVGPVTSYTFNRITHNHEISASFAVNTYTVSVEGNSGGSVNPSGNTVVNYGADLSCSFAPDYGFRISDIKVNNVSQGPVSSFKLSNITADQNISVTFSPIPAYEISAAAGEGGSITPSGSLTLFEGSDQTYEITPDRDHRILDVIVDNHSMGAVDVFTFSNITSDHTLSVRFTTGIDVKAYPNPFAEEIKVNIASPEGYLFDLSVADLSGKVIYAHNKTPGNELMTLNLPVPQGIYFLRLFLKGKKIALVKIIKS
ncbi:MAG TPA: hypothetical protein DCZ51_02765 [Bacteroidales bacterium]|nr:hypothetical protein [Bacteroidales bacterium]